MRVTNQLSIAILICTSNRHRFLKNCLNSIAEQSLLPNHIVVVDKVSKKTKAFERRVRSLIPQSTHLTYKVINSGNISVSRNIALKTAAEDILLFIDDDVILERGYIKKLCKLYELNPKKNFLVGRILPSKNNYWQTFSLKLITSCLADENLEQEVLHWPALNFSMRNRVFKNIRVKFNEKYSGLEDISFCLDLNKVGEKIYYFPDLFVVHSFRDNLKDFSRAFSVYFSNLNRLYRDHLEQDIFNRKLYTKSALRPLKLLINSFKMAQDFKLPIRYFLAFLEYHILVKTSFDSH